MKVTYKNNAGNPETLSCDCGSENFDSISEEQEDGANYFCSSCDKSSELILFSRMDRFKGIIKTSIICEMTGYSPQSLCQIKNELTEKNLAKKLDGAIIYHEDIVPYLLTRAKKKPGPKPNLK